MNTHARAPTSTSTRKARVQGGGQVAMLTRTTRTTAGTTRHDDEHLHAPTAPTVTFLPSSSTHPPPPVLIVVQTCYKPTLHPANLTLSHPAFSSERQARNEGSGYTDLVFLTNQTFTVSLRLLVTQPPPVYSFPTRAQFPLTQMYTYEYNIHINYL